jgi:DNA (cytosine-5)-methyltransferase 1
MNELALFAGAGGGILGGHLLGWRTVCAVEYDAYAASVLVARQNDGCLAPFPIWDDVRTFDGKPWRGIVDVVSGGFPCQDISAAGRGAGIDGERSGLWGEMARIIGELRPKFAFVENSPILTSRGLSRVCGDLAELGYDAQWGVVSAADAGACHLRKRCWIVANAKGTRLAKRRDITECSESPHRKKAQSRRNRPARRGGGAAVEAGVQWSAETVLLRTSHVVANRVDAIKAIGNGQVPAVAAMAWRLLTEEQ